MVQKSIAGIPGVPSVSLSTRLDRWVSLVRSSEPDESVAGLARDGFRILTDHDQVLAPGMHPDWFPIIEVGTADTVHVRLCNRILRRAWMDEIQDRNALLLEIRAVRALMEIAPSRASVYHRCVAHVVASRTGAGGIIGITGEPGIGKTYLWRMVQETILDDPEVNAVILYHKCVQTQPPPYLVYADLLDQACSILTRHTGIERERVLEDLLEPWGIDSGYRDVLDTILAPGGGATLRDVQPPQREFAAVLKDILQSLLARCRDDVGRPVVLVVDDLQWIDPPTWEILKPVVQGRGGPACILLGRPEAQDQLMGLPAGTVETHRIEPLTDAESRVLVESLYVGDDDVYRNPEFVRWTLSRARGNPLAIVESVRSVRQTRKLGDDPGADRISVDISVLSQDARRFARFLALLLPPVDDNLVERIPGMPDAERNDAEQELVRLELLDHRTGDEPVRFRHDVIETLFREEALTDAWVLQEAISILRSAADAGNARAAYAIANMLSDRSDPATAYASHLIPEEEAIAVLGDAARRSMRLVVPLDALRFSRRAIELGHRRNDAATMLVLHQLAHRAAFLLDDAASMSHHFRHIARYGSTVDLNQARALWITRAYVKLWIRGALRIGWKILVELNAVPDGTLSDAGYQEALVDRARWFLRFRTPDSIRRHLATHPVARDPRAELVTTTAAGLFLPMLSLYPSGIVVLARVILEESLRRGTTRFTGFGFVYWSIVASGGGRSLTRRLRLGNIAVDLAEQVALAWERRAGTSAFEGEVASHSIRTFAALFATHWRQTAIVTERRLLALYNEGLRIGNYEPASHAVHVYLDHGLFLRGYPLAALSDLQAEFREKIRRLGLKRISGAMEKFQQAVECLLGETRDPTVLTGSFCTESDVIARTERVEDNLAVAGFYLVKGTVAIYNDQASEALRFFARWVDEESRLASLFNLSPTTFGYGMAAARLGRWDTVRWCLRRLRRIRRAPMARHEYLALRAELWHKRGVNCVADRFRRRAVLLAIEQRYTNEAALIAEYHAASLRERGKYGAARERYLVALGLYRQWGAVPAIKRIQERLRDTEAGHESLGDWPMSTLEVTRHDQMQRKLVNTQLNMELLFEVIPDGLALVDRYGRVLYHNPKAVSYLRERTDDSVTFDPEVSERVTPLVRSAIRDGIAQSTEFRWHTFDLLILISPAPQDHRTGVAAVVIEDVTRQRARERAMIIADRMSSLGMLAATVAHEVGNPNHVIRLNAESLAILLQDATPDVSDALRSISEGSDRINEVIRQVSEYGREGRSEEFVRTDPSETCGRVIRFSDLMVRRYTDRIELDVEPDLPSIIANPGQLEQALINLIRNACEAIQRRTDRIRLAARRSPVDNGQDGVCFSVSDQGHGFNPGGIQLFHTTRSHQGGTGLGLPIVQSIVERHGGSLRFSADSEFATIVELHLPINSG